MISNSLSSLLDNKNQFKAKRILIVDDEPYNIMGLRVLLVQAANLHHLDSYIDQAYNGVEAVQKVKSAYKNGNFSYGLVFMDCSMPIMDGFEATDNIRNYCSQRNVPQPMIVACTGHTEDEFVKKAWKHQMDEFLMKPTSLEVLDSILSEMLQIQKVKL